MPPKGTFHRNPRHAFKPPRPIGAPSADYPSTSTEPVSKAYRPVPKSTRPSTGKGRAALTVLFDSEDEEPTTPRGEQSDDENSNDSTNGRATTAAKSQEQDVIPPKLIVRLVHEHFHHNDTRITKEAMSLFVKYVEVFAREAIARAINERREAVDHGRTGGPAVDFLEVEDLEKLTPQLLLDF